jgi:hypothetical protein
MAATVRSVHAAPVRCGLRPGSAADGHGTPASFSARVIRAALPRGATSHSRSTTFEGMTMSKTFLITPTLTGFTPMGNQAPAAHTTAPPRDVSCEKAYPGSPATVSHVRHDGPAGSLRDRAGTFGIWGPLTFFRPPASRLTVAA